jgi:2-oxoglutarate dehydrogenase complex dehydrogenase (E1) component-like enzyme
MMKEQRLAYAGRKPFAAPASGFLGLHNLQQQELVDQALNLSANLFVDDLPGENE